MSDSRIRRFALLALAIAVLATLAALVILGFRIPDRFATDVWAGHYFHGTLPQPPFPAFTTVEVSSASTPEVHEFHFYTLNRADMIVAICHLLGVRAKKPAVAAVV